MPNKNTFTIKPINVLLKKHVTDNWIDPFANSFVFDWATVITNDINPEYNTNYNLDALEFLKKFKDNSVNGVIFDPPYSPRQIKECYDSIGKAITQETTQSTFWSKLKDEIKRIVIPNGKVISFGWNSNGMGKNRGFKPIQILLISHGGNHNDTICVVERKNGQKQLNFI